MSEPRVTVKWFGQQIYGNVHKAAEAALFEGAEHILEESGRLVPHDTGMLQDSGETDIDARKLEATISYDTPYAVKQHEDTTLNHPNGRQAKYLETAFNQREDEVQKQIAKAIEDAHK